MPRTTTPSTPARWPRSSRPSMSWARRRTSTWCPARTTRSSTTPGPRSTTPRPRGPAGPRLSPSCATSWAERRVSDVVGRYIELGLRLGRHVEGFVDAYYGPPETAARVEAEALRSPAELRADAGRLMADLDSGDGADAVDASRRRWIRAQVLGLHTCLLYTSP